MPNLLVISLKPLIHHTYIQHYTIFLFFSSSSTVFIHQHDRSGIHTGPQDDWWPCGSWFWFRLIFSSLLLVDSAKKHTRPWNHEVYLWKYWSIDVIYKRNDFYICNITLNVCICIIHIFTILIDCTRNISSCITNTFNTCPDISCIPVFWLMPGLNGKIVLKLNSSNRRIHSLVEPRDLL